MGLVSIVKAGRWGLSQPLRELDGGWTSQAAIQRLAPIVEHYFPPRQANGAYTIPAVLVRLIGPVTPPSDSSTILFPRDIADLADNTLGDLTAGQRNAWRTAIESWLPGFTFLDYQGATVIVAPFQAVTSLYTVATSLRQVARDIFSHFQHSTDRPRATLAELHNTEYLDAFATDPFSLPRWTNDLGGPATWDSGNNEIACDVAANWITRYSANGPGSLDHESQVTFKTNSGRNQAGGGAGRFNNAGTGDCYTWAGLDWSNQDQITLEKFVGGTRNTLTAISLTQADNDFLTLRGAYQGVVGANVLCSVWANNHGSTKPSDPGWYGADGSPLSTYTDTASDRLDDAAHDQCGVSGRTGGLSYNNNYCFFKERAVSDRGGAATERHQTRRMIQAGGYF